LIAPITGNLINFSMVVDSQPLRDAMAATADDYIPAFFEVRATTNGQDELLLREAVIITKAASTGGAIIVMPTSFLALTDTPDSYAGYAGQVVVVKATEDGLTFAPEGGGAAVQGVWLYKSVNTMADPGSGALRTNTTALATATQIAISQFTNNNFDRSSAIMALQVGDELLIQDTNNTNVWAQYNVTSLPVNNVTWFQIGVSFVSGGTGTNPSNNDPLNITFPATSGGGGGAAEVIGETPTGVIDGSNRLYYTANVFRSNTLMVYLNGLRLRQSADYAINSGDSFMMGYAPLAGDSLNVDYLLP
jgi:hypothetical protein